MTNIIRTTLFTVTALMITGPGAVYADHDDRSRNSPELLLHIAASYPVVDTAFHRADDRPGRSRHGRGHNPRYNQNYAQGYNHDATGSSRGFSNRHDTRYDGRSVTSEPIRGGSSRRTRVVENPYPNRPLRGITFTGIEHDAVHINDVIIYPRKWLVSHSGYSLSLYHPGRFIPTRGYVDYISVKAKRREYFTVTFHYE